MLVFFARCLSFRRCPIIRWRQSMRTKWQGPWPSLITITLSLQKKPTTSFLIQNAETYRINGEMLSSLRYIKHYIRFPKDIKPFWDDTRYILHIDPNVRYVQYPSIGNSCKFFHQGGDIRYGKILKPKVTLWRFFTFFDDFIILAVQ